ncbi:MAG: ferric reductase-like transmembrane domain-containing protein [Actinomycetota bacterium]
MSSNVLIAASKTDWYLLRSSGIVALLFLSVSVAFGVSGIARLVGPRWNRYVSTAVHRNVALIGMIFLGLHGVTAVLDKWVYLGWLGLIVPFQSGYRPLAIGLGVIAGDILVIVTITSLLRNRMSYTAWRMVHLSTWLLLPLSVLHTVLGGSDALARIWGLVATAIAGSIMLFALGIRLTIGRRDHYPDALPLGAQTLNPGNFRLPDPSGPNERIR